MSGIDLRSIEELANELPLPIAIFGAVGFF
jgi:hypothetical protein